MNDKSSLWSGPQVAGFELFGPMLAMPSGVSNTGLPRLPVRRMVAMG
jgi:hypothetical protein